MMAPEDSPAYAEAEAEREAQIERIWATDPGERTGWCVADIDWAAFDPKTGEGFSVPKQGVNDYTQMQRWAIRTVRNPDEVSVDTIVYETWRLYGSHAKALIGNDMQPSQVVGLIRLVGTALGVKIKSQNASIKNIADATMPEWVKVRYMNPSTEIHDQDAIRHAWHYAYAEWVRRNKTNE